MSALTDATGFKSQILAISGFRIHVEGGSGNYGSATGDYTLDGGNVPRTFSCLEANGHCNGLRVTPMGFEENASPTARVGNSNTLSMIFFIRDGTKRPNQYGGTDLYYIKDGNWHVMRTMTKPQVPDFVLDETVKFYADPHSGFYAVGSSGDSWSVVLNPNASRSPANP